MSFSENPSEDSKPNIGREIEGYQYTSSGQVNGVNGNVDLNILYSTNNSSSNSPSTPTIKNTVKVNTTLNVRNKPNGTVIDKLKNYLPKTRFSGLLIIITTNFIFVTISVIILIISHEAQ